MRKIICEFCNVEVETNVSNKRFCSQKCTSSFNIRRKKERFINQLKLGPCEVCGITPEIIFGSARFCSKTCSKKYSNIVSKEKRSFIRKKFYEENPYPIDTEKVRIINNIQYRKLSKNLFLITCRVCKKEFENDHLTTYCSDECIKKSYTPEFRPKFFENVEKITNEFSGRKFGKKVEHVSQFGIIKCDSLLEWSCLENFIRNDNVISISRFNGRIPYEFQGRLKSYQPDFEIITETKKYIVEVKDDLRRKEGASEKWNMYVNQALEKKKVLEKWCSENGYEMFWFTPSSIKSGLYAEAKKKFSVKSEAIE